MSDSEVTDAPVKENLQVSKEEAAGFCMQLCALYVMPHFANQLEEGKVAVEAAETPEEKFALAKDVLATCVLNHHVNMALKALVAEKEREKNNTGISPSAGTASDGVR